MATRASIEFDFQRARQQADTLEQIASRLDRLVGQEFAGTMQDISHHWKGQNADAYLGKASRLQSNMSASARSLATIANNIRTAAKRMYDAEMEALRIAEERLYQGQGNNIA